MNERRKQRLAGEEIAGVQRREDRRRNQCDRDFRMSGLPHQVDDDSAGENLLREADEETGQQPGCDETEAGLAVVGGGKSQDVEQEHDGDGNPHPSSAPNRLAREQLFQPPEREREDHEDHPADRDRQSVGEQNGLDAVRRANQRSDQRDESQGCELVQPVIDGGGQKALPPSTALPETLPTRRLTLLRHFAPPWPTDPGRAVPLLYRAVYARGQRVRPSVEPLPG